METRHQHNKALKVQVLVDEMQKEVRKLVYTVNGQRNLTKLSISSSDFVNKLEFMPEDQKIQMVQTQTKAEEMREKAAKYDKFTALKLA